MSSASEPIREVGAQLAALEAHMRRRGDANAHFVSMYRVTTERCRRTVDAITQSTHPRHAALRHLDARLITDIVCHFAPRYLEPWRAFETATLQRTSPWLRVFQAAHGSRPGTVLLLGAHTHICFDLPLVLTTRIHPDAPLFDPADPVQRVSLRALDAIFMADIDRIVARVRQSEYLLASRDTHATGGVVRLLYGARLRRALRRPLTLLLAAARAGARRDALKLQSGALDEAALAAAVDRRNRAFLALPGREKISRASASA